LETGTIQTYDFEFHEHPSQPLKALYELRFESFGYTPGLPESLRGGLRDSNISKRNSHILIFHMLAPVESKLSVTIL